MEDISLSLNERVILFLEGNGKDHAGRTIDFVLDQNDEWMEKTCDYIQWLFPLDDETRQAEFVPVLKNAEIDRIRESKLARENLIKAASRMRRFWGKGHWIKELDHNHLRITRTIKSLRLLVSDEEADKMKIWLSSVLGPNNKIINQKSIQFWREA